MKRKILSLSIALFWSVGALGCKNESNEPPPEKAPQEDVEKIEELVPPDPDADLSTLQKLRDKFRAELKEITKKKNALADEETARNPAVKAIMDARKDAADSVNRTFDRELAMTERGVEVTKREADLKYQLSKLEGDNPAEIKKRKLELTKALNEVLLEKAELSRELKNNLAIKQARKEFVRMDRELERKLHKELSKSGGGKLGELVKREDDLKAYVLNLDRRISSKLRQEKMQGKKKQPGPKGGGGESIEPVETDPEGLAEQAEGAPSGEE